MYVEVDPDKCEMNALCVGLAPEVFDFGENDELTVAERPGDEQWDSVRAAAFTCPRQAITVSR